MAQPESTELNVTPKSGFLSGIPEKYASIFWPTLIVLSLLLTACVYYVIKKCCSNNTVKDGDGAQFSSVQDFRD